MYGIHPMDETILSINYGSAGTGGATCGPATLPQYRLPSDRVYEWEFTMMPVASDATKNDMSEAAKAYHTVAEFNREEYDAQLAADIIERIDSFVAYDYSQLKEAEELLADVNALTDAQKALVNADKDRTAQAGQILKDVQAMKYKTAYIQDQSKNNLQVPYAKSAKFEKSGDQTVMNGSLPVPFNEVLNPVFQGDGTSFTVEVNVTPTAAPAYNMFAGKGDYAFALRARGNTHVDFHIFAGGSWRSIEYAMTAEQQAEWVNNEHQVVGIYNAASEKIQLYVDGALMKEKATGTTSGVAESGYNLTIGACPDTGRTSAADFSNIRVYNRALTADEVAGQYSANPAITAENEAVELWMDLGDLKFKDNGKLESPFEDVAETDYFYDAVLWATENKITDGWTESLFAPDLECSRGEIVTFLYRAQK
ncbi:MAG: LamG-like jellyroll fold domain-containing protein [Lachnospiraceae bacterium]